MKTRKVLYADEGMVLTNGTTYGEVVFLGDGDNEFAYYEIPQSQYEKIMEEREKAENPQ